MVRRRSRPLVAGSEEDVYRIISDSNTTPEQIAAAERRARERFAEGRQLGFRVSIEAVEDDRYRIREEWTRATGREANEVLARELAGELTGPPPQARGSDDAWHDRPRTVEDIVRLQALREGLFGDCGHRKRRERNVLNQEERECRSCRKLYDRRVENSRRAL